jgi:hypothetical protein
MSLVYATDEVLLWEHLRVGVLGVCESCVER